MTEKPEKKLYFDVDEAGSEEEVIAELNLENLDDLLLVAEMLKETHSEAKKKDCGRLLKVWYTYPCINGWSYICQHQKWEKCATTKRCNMRDKRC